MSISRTKGLNFVLVKKIVLVSGLLNEVNKNLSVREFILFSNLLLQLKLKY